MSQPKKCLDCGAAASPGSVRKSFLLFPNFVCGYCKRKNVYPASAGAQILHWILAIVFVVIFLAGLLLQQLMIPGILFIAGFWGIFVSWRIRREHREFSMVEQPVIHVVRSGEPETFGLPEVNRMMAGGQMTGDEMAWREGMDDWSPLMKVPGVVRSGPPPLRNSGMAGASPLVRSPLSQTGQALKPKAVDSPMSSAGPHSTRRLVWIGTAVFGALAVSGVGVQLARSFGRGLASLTPPVNQVEKTRLPEGPLEEYTFGGISMLSPSAPKLAAKNVPRALANSVKSYENYKFSTDGLKIEVIHAVYFSGRVNLDRSAAGVVSSVRALPDITSFSGGAEKTSAAGLEAREVEMAYIGSGHHTNHYALIMADGGDYWLIQVIGKLDDQPALGRMKNRIFESVRLSSVGSVSSEGKE